MKHTSFITALLVWASASWLSVQATAVDLSNEIAQQNTPEGWTAVQLPTGIPDITEANTFVITDAPFHASTSSEDNTAAIQAALDAASSAGGGMVVIPAGTYLSGNLTIGSKTVLHLSAGATLMMKAMTTYPQDGNGYYMMATPFIMGKDKASDIIIEGESRETSIIDGQGAPWWKQVEDAKAAKKSTTRAAMIRFWQGNRYLFRNFRIQNTPNTNITIGNGGKGAHTTAHAITISNPSSEAAIPSHNTDGFPIWTDHVNIYDCYIDTGDDNVVCDRYAQYVHVWDCDFKAGHGASFGSYTTGMHDIIYEDLRLDGTDAGFRLKSNNDRSGDVYNIVFRNVTMNNVANPVNITCWYDSLPSSPAYIDAHAYDSTELTPVFRDILIQNVTASGDTKYKRGTSDSQKDRKYFGVFIYGRPESYVRNVMFDNVHITHSKGMRLNFCKDIQFKDCSFEVYNTTSGYTQYNCSSTEEGLPDLMFENRDEFRYKGSYSWIKSSAFVDFKIDFRSNPYTVLLPANGTLPENVSLTNITYNDAQHGIQAGTITVAVSGPTKFTIGTCRYGNGSVTIRKNDEVLESVNTKTETCDSKTSYAYYVTWIYNSEEPATLSFTLNNGYMPYFFAEATELLPEKNAAGYYSITAGDAAELQRVLDVAAEGDKIFLPNGIYDLGTRVLTSIHANNLSIIGESMEGTIIRNAPHYTTESINNTATLLIPNGVSGTYLQDLTLQNALDYYTAIETSGNGRAIALQDEGTHTVCKNVRLLSFQDTYYTHNAQGGANYFEDCEIHGTVDFICGNGSVYFLNTLLYSEQRYRDSSGGSNAITAHNGSETDKGYVFEGCTIQSRCGVVSLGRAWNYYPKATFLNTLADYSQGTFSFTDSQGKIARWTRQLMAQNAWPVFSEYNTHLQDGTLLTPATNVVTFINKDDPATTDLETVLSEEQASVYTKVYTLGEWAQTATADARQATADEHSIAAEGVYIVENAGELVSMLTGAALSEVIDSYTGYTMRRANSRGGFGVPATITGLPSAIENKPMQDICSRKELRNGQLVIIRDSKVYTVLGARVK